MGLSRPPRFEIEHSERAPLLWLLAPFATGIAVSLPGSILLKLSIASLSALLGLCFLNKERIMLLWKIFYLLSAFFIGNVYIDFITPGHFSLPKELPSSITLQTKIIQLFKPFRGGKIIQGLGIVESVSEKNLKELEKQKIYFTARTTDKQAIKGSVVELKGRIQPIDVAKTDFETFLKKKQCVAKIYSKHLKITQPPPLIRQKSYAVREHLIEQLKRGADNPQTKQLANITTAMTLGAKEKLNKEQKGYYSKTGTMHLFAVSGLHVGWVALFLSIPLILLRLPNPIKIISLIVALLFYVQITGASPSATRAWMMVSCFLAAGLLKRKPCILSSLVASACVILLIRPNELFSIGFQLSYMVVFGILLYGLPLNYYLQEKIQFFQWIPKNNLKIWQKCLKGSLSVMIPLLSISFSASLFSSAIIIGSFGIFSPISIILNFLLVPLSGLIIFASLLSLLCGSLGIEIATIFLNKSAWVWVHMMQEIIRIGIEIPHGHFIKYWSHSALNVIVPVTLLALTAFYIPHKECSIKHLLLLPVVLLIFLII